MTRISVCFVFYDTILYKCLIKQSRKSVVKHAIAATPRSCGVPSARKMKAVLVASEQELLAGSALPTVAIDRIL